MKSAKKIRILLVDDHPVVREGVRSCLASHPNLEIVGEAADGQDAVHKAEKLTPDVVLMDINIPRVNGLTATAEICRRAPQARVLALTAHHNPEYVQRVIAAGARGYVLKDATPQELMSAIQTIHQGGTFFSPSVANGLLKSFVEQAGQSVPAERSIPLSDRERQVLALIAEGLANKEIADVLGVSVRTVETHRERLMIKLNIHTVAGLTKYAINQGLVSLE